MSGVVNRVNKTSDKTGEEKMRKLLTLLLLLVLAVGCNKEEGPAVIEEPAKVEEAVPT